METIFKLPKISRKNKATYTTYYYQQKKSPWKKRGFIFLFVLFATILCLPTVIVMIPQQESTEMEAVETASIQQESSATKDAPAFDVDVKRTNSGDIEKVPLEDYVTSVVSSEMPAEFETEALKAQAIAARTYIVNHLNNHDGEDAVISDQTDDQVYLNKEELQQKWGKQYRHNMNKISSAVEATKNIIITYHDTPITPTFFSMSNGYTEDAENYWGNELPYLKSVESKWEENEAKFTDQKIFTREALAEQIGLDITQGVMIPIEMTRTASHRVDKITMNGSTFSGKELREKLSLRSNDFTVKQKDDHFIFTTKGYGHGVGMSQYGANGMAEEGKNYEEILHYYYQDIELQTIKEATPTLVSA